jgi:glycosyltransferase involved in cell wall biosynthesis
MGLAITRPPVKILQIGNYPPPMCGWAIQLKLVTDELHRRGHMCEVLKINEGRQIKDPSYIDVQGGLDYLRKVWHYALLGYRLNVHVNGMSKKGYWLALIAVVTGRLVGRPTLLTFHGGLSQKYFPRHDDRLLKFAFRALFNLAGQIACDSSPIKQGIEKYGIDHDKVQSIATFSSQYLEFTPAALPDKVEDFLSSHNPTIFSYVSFRPEYRLEVVRQAMAEYRKSFPQAGFIWLGFPGRELLAAEESVRKWPAAERGSLLVLGNLAHDQFLTLLSRSFICLRTPACDGVAASVLESLALGIPVVASENGSRPAGVVTYNEVEPSDMCAKLLYTTMHHQQLQAGLKVDDRDDNVGMMADWLTGETNVPVGNGPVAVS